MSYEQGLVEAYQGEVYGLALYRGIAAAQRNADHAGKWRAIAKLEIVMKEALAPVLKRRGIPTADDPAYEAQGRMEISEYAVMSWPALMERFGAELDEDIVRYGDLLNVAPVEDRAALELLVEHEVAVQNFCALETQGLDDRALEPVLEIIAKIEAFNAKTAD